MTYQKPNAYDDNTDADESSSLFLTVTDASSSSSSSSFGQDGVATTKKNHGVRMIVVVAICFFLLGTMAVVHQGNSSSSSSNNRAPDDTTMLNQDMMLVGVQEEEQVQGNRCCPDDWNDCTPNILKFPDKKCRHKRDGCENCVDKHTGDVCKSLGFGTDKCCPDSISNHYTQWLLGGCVRNSCFQCVSGESCCHTKDGLWDYSCPNCGDSF